MVNVRTSSPALMRTWQLLPAKFRCSLSHHPRLTGIIWTLVPVRLLVTFLVCVRSVSVIQMCQLHMMSPAASQTAITAFPCWMVVAPTVKRMARPLSYRPTFEMSPEASCHKSLHDLAVHPSWS